MADDRRADDVVAAIVALRAEFDDKVSTILARLSTPISRIEHLDAGGSRYGLLGPGSIELTFTDAVGALFGGRLTLYPGFALLSAGSGSGSAVPGSAVTAQTSGQVDLYNDAAEASVLIEADGDIRLNPAAGKEITTSRPIGTLGAGFSFHAQSGDSDGYRFIADGGGLRVAGNSPNQFIALGDGTGNYKSFIIDHPTDPQRWLVHGCTESPNVGVEYWGEAVITGGAAVVDLPGYFEALTRPDGRQVQVSVVLPDEPAARTVDPPPVPELPAPDDTVPEHRREGVRRRHREAVERVDRLRKAARATVIPEHAMLPRVAASTVRDGRFRIACDAADGSRVAWLVKAIRRAIPPFDPEPLKSDVKVRGDGPYRYIAERTPDRGPA